MAQDDYVRTALRLPPSLHGAIHAAADAAGRSFNAEIIDRLLGSFDARSGNEAILQLINDTRAELLLLRKLTEQSARAAGEMSALLRHSEEERADLARRLAGLEAARKRARKAEKNRP